MAGTRHGGYVWTEGDSANQGRRVGSMSLRFHWMFPKGGEVAMKTPQATSRVLTTRSTSPAALPDMDRVDPFRT